MSQSELARKSGVDQSSISAYERDERAMTDATADKLARALGRSSLDTRPKAATLKGVAGGAPAPITEEDVEQAARDLLAALSAKDKSAEDRASHLAMLVLELPRVRLANQVLDGGPFMITRAIELIAAILQPEDARTPAKPKRGTLARS